MTLVDTHVHFHFDAFDADRSQTLERARASGVEGFVNVGTTLQDSGAAVALAEGSPGMVAAVGIHPHDASTFKDRMAAEFEALSQKPCVRAIGEVGLDYYRDLSPRETQQTVFCFFIELAARVGLPLVLHSRDAYPDLFKLLKATRRPVRGGVLHCFGGSEDELRAGLDLGFYASFAGNVTYKKNDALRTCARLVPKDRLLIETDAPFLAPQAHRGKRNEPAFLPETLACLAAVRGVAPEELAEQTTANAKQLFRLEEP